MVPPLFGAKLAFCFLGAYVKAVFLELCSTCSSVFPFSSHPLLHIYTSNFSCQRAPPFLRLLAPAVIFASHPQLCNLHYIFQVLLFPFFMLCLPPSSTSSSLSLPLLSRASDHYSVPFCWMNELMLVLFRPIRYFSSYKLQWVEKMLAKREEVFLKFRLFPE